MATSEFKNLESEVLSLRKIGKSYGEIRKILGHDIPKSTLSNWCKDLSLSCEQKTRIKTLVELGAKKGLATALVINKEKRNNYVHEVRNRIKHLPQKLEDKDVAKISLAMLYLGEGSKTTKGGLMLGNSDPTVICLFLRLFRFCYNIDETKFRCTVQCRADQNIEALEEFWSIITGIPRGLFYKAQVDKRTIGKASKKIDYKGVCRIDYFSGDIFLELMQTINLICGK